MTNSERRVSLVEKAVEPPGEARPDWQIFADFARHLGFEQGFNWADSAAVFEEFKGLTAGRDLDMTGMSYSRLKEASLQWPCPAEDHPGTPRLYTDGQFQTNDGRARFAPLENARVAEPTDPQYPFVLTTGRVRDQWHTMTRTGHVPTLLKVEGQPFIELHPDDAKKLEVVADQPLEVRSRRGRAVFKAVITDKIRPGTVFVPFHWGKLFQTDPQAGVCNDLTTGAVDPISKQPELKACAVMLTALVAAPELNEWLHASHQTAIGLEAPRR